MTKFDPRVMTPIRRESQGKGGMLLTFFVDRVYINRTAPNGESLMLTYADAQWLAGQLARPTPKRKPRTP